ncbi:hypothetical protein ACGFWI_01185 [Streptomyces sp. NPDC048434]|uniref:hypothetical protein n=1 Tax=Streptomyces sp. NPDC048434 TaxID=3365549 RepID=UPI003715059B
MPQIAYLIACTDDDTDEDHRVMSRGTQTLADGQDPAAFAADRLAQNRVEHSYYTGRRRIAYWPHELGAPLPRTAPAEAQHLDG